MSQDQALDALAPEGAEDAQTAAAPEAADGRATAPRPAPSILQLAWPAIVGNLLYSLVGFIDIKIVGSLGASAVAAVTTGNRIFFVMQAVLMAVGAGTTAMVARAWGAEDRDEAERVTRASTLVGVAIGLLLSLPGLLFAREMAGIFRLDGETLDLAATFIRWLSVFNVSFAVSMMIGTALRAAGDTLTPLAIGAVTNVVNVVLLYGLVFGELGLPKMGVAGAAVANGVAFTVGAVISLVLWLRGQLLLGVGHGKSVTRERVGQLMRIGYPAGLEQAAWQAGFIIFLWIVALYGTEPYAAYGIGVNILSFSFVVGFGFSIAGSTHVGQHLGAEDPEGAARSGWHAMRLSIIAMAVLGSLIIFFAHEIASFMIDDPEVIRYTVAFIYILGAVQPLMAIEFSLGGSLRGAGDTRFPLVTTLTGLIGVRAALAGLFAWIGLDAIWIYAALIADYIVKATMLTLRFRSGRWKTIEVSARPR